MPTGKAATGEAKSLGDGWRAVVGPTRGEEGSTDGPKLFQETVNERLGKGSVSTGWKKKKGDIGGGVGGWVEDEGRGGARKGEE